MKGRQIAPQPTIDALAAAGAIRAHTGPIVITTVTAPVKRLVVAIERARRAQPAKVKDADAVSAAPASRTAP